MKLRHRLDGLDGAALEWDLRVSDGHRVRHGDRHARLCRGGSHHNARQVRVGWASIELARSADDEREADDIEDVQETGEDDDDDTDAGDPVAHVVHNMVVHTPSVSIAVARIKVAFRYVALTVAHAVA